MRIGSCQLTEIIDSGNCIVMHSCTAYATIDKCKCNENVTHMDMLHIRCNPAMHFA